MYALFDRFAGLWLRHRDGARGDCLRGSLRLHARSSPRWTRSTARRSRVLEKLGFERIATVPGAFGNMFRLRLSSASATMIGRDELIDQLRGAGRRDRAAC